ncbi:TPA: DUF550 domain-containing protein [Klebsiella pneumoniae]|nr:DUF550 domain-containing protein [Klebsiella pneumoniae]
MTSKLTRERIEQYANDPRMCNINDEIRQMARMVLAAMDSEPVAYTEKHEISNMHATGLYLRAWPADRARNAVEGYTIPLYRHAQPASDREQVRREHAEWSQATFGNVGPVGPLKHLSKEALEAAAEPGDLSEWADMQFLLWDAQRRAGITDEQITQAMIEKLAVNKQREWPEPKEGEPRLHIKEQQAPVAQCPYPCGWDTLNKLAIQDAAFVALALVAGEPATESIRSAVISNNDRLLKVISFCRDMMPQAGNSPVIPDGYVMVPVEPTKEILDEFDSIIDYGAEDSVDAWHRLLATAPQSPGGEPATVPGKWIPVSERMPEVGDIVLTAMGGVVNVGEMECSAANCRFFTSVISGRELPATHWMPLPAAPQEVNRE